MWAKYVERTAQSTKSQEFSGSEVSHLTESGTGAMGHSGLNILVGLIGHQTSQKPEADTVVEYWRKGGCCPLRYRVLRYVQAIKISDVS